MTEYPVLLVEDNPRDVLIARRAWKKEGIRNPMYVVNDGEKALRFLRRDEEYSDAPTPCLILLDLNMPRMNGFKVLEEIKGDDELSNIPVIILTTSERDQDIERAYQLGCQKYIVKSMSFSNFIKTIVEIKLFWLPSNNIPSEMT